MSSGVAEGKPQSPARPTSVRSAYHEAGLGSSFEAGARTSPTFQQLSSHTVWLMLSQSLPGSQRYLPGPQLQGTDRDKEQSGWGHALVWETGFQAPSISNPTTSQMEEVLRSVSDACPVDPDLGPKINQSISEGFGACICVRSACGHMMNRSSSSRAERVTRCFESSALPLPPAHLSMCCT